MLALLKVSLLSLCLSLGLANSTTNGLTASLDIAVVEQAKDVYFDKIMQLIQSVQIPNYDDGDIYLHDNSFTLDQDASGVVFAILTAFAMIYPNRELFIFLMLESSQREKIPLI